MNDSFEKGFADNLKRYNKSSGNNPTNKQKIGKPDCTSCKKEYLGRDFVIELIYSIFNPYYTNDKPETGYAIEISKFIKQSIENEELKNNYEIFAHLFDEIIRDFGYPSFLHEKFDEYKKAKKKAWKEIKNGLIRGSITKTEVSCVDLINYFYDEIINDLEKDGYILSTGMPKRHIKYSPEAERILGEKILKLSYKNMKKKWYGETPTNEKGISILFSNHLQKFDSFTHTFDMIDIQETLIKSAKKGRIEIEEKDIVIREPEHTEKCQYVILIDCSDSMKGKKIIGAMEAALALQKAIKQRNLDDLKIFAFNHTIKRIRSGEIINLCPKGRTDIGLALKTARGCINKGTGSGIIYLITDGEPTISSTPNKNPQISAIEEARKLNRIDAQLEIIMFGRNHRFQELCKEMAKATQNSNAIFFEDPFNLKSYIVKQMR